MPHDKMRTGGYSPKPETEAKFTQVVAQGATEPAYDSVDVEKEAKNMGAGKRVGGHGQGGAGH